jgi:hypothetical protein
MCFTSIGSQAGESALKANSQSSHDPHFTSQLQPRNLTFLHQKLIFTSVFNQL